MEQEQYDRQKTSNTDNSKIHYLNFPKKPKSSIIAAKDFANKLSESNYPLVQDLVFDLKPSIPTYFVRPNSIKKAARWFLSNFRGDVLYSVKSNPDVSVLQNLFDSGVRNFDVASLPEIKLISQSFGDDVKMYFMNTMKSREAIYEAYFNYGIRNFSLDSFDELHKILEVTKNAKDLGLHLRLAIPNSHAAIDLSGKFGILPTESIDLIRKIRGVAKYLGICFHVGSQCMDPSDYRSALMTVKDVLEQSKVRLDVLDIGGGFPSSYPGLTPPNLDIYFNEIYDSLHQLPIDKNCKLWCEPGRALVAESTSLLVRVEGRKKNMLYINDGTYGGLFDAGHPGFIYPTKSIRVKTDQALSSQLIPFGFYGPVCDSLDTMKGPFYLPENIAEGDYIEIGQLGAYSKTIRTDFNGFSKNLQFEVQDEPLISMYKNYELLAKKKSLRKSVK
jgi:ornithine decarboxylase